MYKHSFKLLSNLNALLSLLESIFNYLPLIVFKLIETFLHDFEIDLKIQLRLLFWSYIENTNFKDSVANVYIQKPLHQKCHHSLCVYDLNC